MHSSEHHALEKVDIVNVANEEKGKKERPTWSPAAVHAHQCCVSQKHPAFVFLRNLLIKEADLSAERVSLWKFKEYLIAARNLECFVKEQRKEGPFTHKITLMPKEEPQAEKPEEPWQDYPASKKENLFNLGSP